jgi:hypothetical protein
MEKLVDGKLIEEKLVEGILDLARLVFNEAYTEDNAKPHEETMMDLAAQIMDRAERMLDKMDRADKVLQVAAWKEK